MASENIKQRKIYRICSDAANKIWDRIYFLTNAASVDANDGLDMETKVGAVKGITTSTNVTEKGYAADATVVKELNDSLGGLRFGTDGDGNCGYYGADGSLIPFKQTDLETRLDIIWRNTELSESKTYTVEEDGVYLALLTASAYNLSVNMTSSGQEIINQIQETGSNASRKSIINVSRCQAGDTIVIEHLTPAGIGYSAMIAKVKMLDASNILLKHYSINPDLASKTVTIDVAENSKYLAICTSKANIPASAYLDIPHKVISEFIIGSEMHTTFLHLAPTTDAKMKVVCTGTTSWGNMSIYILEFN